MTESEWQACTEPQKMLEFLQGKVSERKLRLFTVACCRRLWILTTGEEPAELAIAEMFADGKAEAHLLVRVVETLQQPLASVRRKFARGRPFYLIHEPMLVAFRIGSALLWGANASGQFLQAAYWTGPANYDRASINARYTARETESARQVVTARCIFGHLPFRCVTINSAWLAWNDGTVQKIAQAIYDECAFDRLPILADALEESGCTDADILNHCRQPAEHVRGCWVVDLILGKS